MMADLLALSERSEVTFFGSSGPVFMLSWFDNGPGWGANLQVLDSMGTILGDTR